ncbi:hypothetical protein BDZ91DRAFT_775075 [Kalaharituber pfeilii]|nr:hypothetical protein BDZ91DRAFT_775075 [Kalaharituber pfeilii]
MSIDINWSTLTTGPDGAALALQIRDFIHDKFQRVPLPKFIQSVQVVSFDFGSVAPDVEIKSIGDPYPEFYENDEDEDEHEEGEEDARSVDGDGGGGRGAAHAFEEELERELRKERERRRRDRRLMMMMEDNASSGLGAGGVRTLSSSAGGSKGGLLPETAAPIPISPPNRRPGIGGFRSASESFRQGGVSTPLFPFPIPTGGTSSLHYFHSTLSSAFANGSPSPLPAVAASERGHTSSTPPPPSPPHLYPSSPTSISSFPPRDTDIQIIARVRYTGDIRIELTTQLLLDYPARSFVSLPVRLVVTGLTFDGLACVAWMGRKLHFCFLEEESAVNGARCGSMLKEIKVESEIGEKGKGKQVLKNVGKVERFVLEQVRRIFEDEFVFPSSWTFLV